MLLAVQNKFIILNIFICYVYQQISKARWIDRWIYRSNAFRPHNRGRLVRESTLTGHIIFRQITYLLNTTQHTFRRKKQTPKHTSFPQYKSFQDALVFSGNQYTESTDTQLN